MIIKLTIGFVCFLLLVIFIESVRKKRNPDDMPEDDRPDLSAEHAHEEEICCGAHEVCEKDLLKLSLLKETEYYDDEELDIYQGRTSDAYKEGEIEEFREILYSLLPGDVSGWLRSLQIRQIELPDELKDEAFMLKTE